MSFDKIFDLTAGVYFDFYNNNTRYSSGACATDDGARYTLHDDAVPDA